MLSKLTRRFISLDAQRLKASLSDVDPQMFQIIQKEGQRQVSDLNLIASENLAPRSVMEALSSPLINKYSEGYPGRRYYGGNQHIDEAESLCRQRALEVFKLDPKEWSVNVQALSGSPANFQVFSALLEPGDTIMCLHLPDGGHLSHGFETATKKISHTAKHFQVVPYKVDPSTGLIDYQGLAQLAETHRPKVLIAGTTAYSRLLDYRFLRQLCDRLGIHLHGDMSHISGLVAAGLVDSPFHWCDTVVSTTHKTLRGPRAAMIFSRQKFGSLIDEAVFPGLQGGPHNHTIGGLAVALLLARAPEFVEYQRQVLTNAQAMAKELQRLGYTLISDGTDTHLMVVNLKPQKLSGAKTEKICEAAGITLNKNTVPGDASALNPSGIRIGTPALTSRGFLEADFQQVAQYLDECIQIGQEVQEASGPKLSTFSQTLKEAPHPRLVELAREIREFTSGFPLI